VNTHDEPTVRVTLGTIYDKLLHLEAVIAPLPGHVLDHEVRIRAIEKYLWILIGASGVLGAGAGQLINFLLNP
jgi:hypothetical protein